MNDDALRKEVQALSERVATLEARPEGEEQQAPTADQAGFWPLTGLQSRLAEDPSTADGAVLLVGSLTLPTGAPVAWQQGAGTSGLFQTEWSDRAQAFAALGHPMRVELLRHILGGVHATADLAAIESLGTTGQLHHHLRQLIAAGWVRHRGRGSYEVPAGRVVPLLACLVAVER